jgi:primosomal protein N' (replication factor Y)
VPGVAESPLPAATAAAARGERVRAGYLIGGGPWGHAIAGLVSAVLAAGRNVAVIAPTVSEAEAIAASVAEALAITISVVTSSAPAAQVTKTWAAAQSGGGRLLVGTRELAFWPMGDLGMIVVVEEGRPAMTEPQTPTTSVRDIVRRRATTERFVLVFAGPVPTVETLAAGVELREPASRVWPLVEIVDRSEEPPGGGVVMQATVRAVQATLARRERGFIFVPRRGEAAAFRCVKCGELRHCPNCSAAVTRGDVCQRCSTRLYACAACGGERFQALGAGVGRVVAELRRVTGEVIGRPGDDLPITVGTERDLPGVENMAFSAVVDADALVLAPHYRAEEDALRTLARVALTVERGRGRRCLVQTSQPNHRVFQALRHGRPVEMLRTLLAERADAGFPPVTELLAIEMERVPPGADAALRAAAHGGSVLGPAPSGDGSRWLVSAPDLRPTKVRLRSLVQSWRDAGARVRVDADPVRL